MTATEKHQTCEEVVTKKAVNPNPGARERLLEAAVDIFGRHGYEAATTRMITAEAGANIAAIPYYFGGKEGLYRAVINHVVETLNQEIGGLLEDIRTLSGNGDIDRNLALQKLQDLIEKLIQLIVGSSQGQRFARIIMREQTYPSSDYDQIYSGVMEPVLDTIAMLVMAAGGESSEHRAKLRSMAIIGQVLAFRFARETIVRSLKLQGYNPEELDQIREVIIEHIRAILD